MKPIKFKYTKEELLKLKEAQDNIRIIEDRNISIYKNDNGEKVKDIKIDSRDYIPTVNRTVELAVLEVIKYANLDNLDKIAYDRLFDSETNWLDLEYYDNYKNYHIKSKEFIYEYRYDIALELLSLLG
jgi:hypothetical protein